MTDDSTDGRPWPIDPIHPPTPEAGPAPVPELAPADDPLGALADFAGAVNGTVIGAPKGAANGDAPHAASDAPPSTADAGGPVVSDDDRTRYGLLLDRAAERGLLSPHDYQVKLGELADATSIDEMNMIVTDLPVLTVPPTASRRTTSKRSSVAVAPGVGLAAVGGRRRSSPWVLLGVLGFVVLVSVVFFYIYAEHLVHSRGAGVVALPGAARALSALRL